MSGGSWNYLVWADDLGGRIDDLTRMAARLEAENGPHAARATRDVIRMLNAAERIADQSLREVWRAVEWRDSSDYGPEAITEAIAEYGEYEPGKGRKAADSES